jgi:hypothetical protein
MPAQASRNASQCICSHMNKLSYLLLNCDEKGWRDKVGMHAFVNQRQGMKVRTAPVDRVLRPTLDPRPTAALLGLALPAQRYC